MSEFRTQMRSNSIFTYELLCTKNVAVEFADHLVHCGIAFACYQVSDDNTMFNLTNEGIAQARRYFGKDYIGYELLDSDRNG